MINLQYPCDLRCVRSQGLVGVSLRGTWGVSDICPNRAVREAALVPGRLVLSECSCLDPPAQEVVCVPVTDY